MKLLLLAAAVTAAATAGAEPAAGRWHFTFPGEPPFAHSVLFSRGPGGDETRLLVQTPAGRFELLSRQPADGSATFESVTDLASGERLARRLSYGAEPSIAPCAQLVPPDACVVLEGPGGRRLEERLSTFAGEARPRLLARAREVAGPALLGRLASLARVFPSSVDFDPYGDDFLALVDPALVPRKSLRRGTRGPGCAFDASFGFPCSAEEKRRDERLARP